MTGSFIKNEHLLTNLTEAELATLRTRAELHRRYANLDFKVLSCTNDVLILRVRQGKPFSGNVFDVKRLAAIGKELVESVGSWTFVHVRPYSYNPPPTLIVSEE